MVSSETFGPPKNITESKKTTNEVPRVQGYSVKKSHGFDPRLRKGRGFCMVWWPKMPLVDGCWWMTQLIQGSRLIYHDILQKKREQKKSITDIHGHFYPTSTFKTRLWLCFFVDLTSFPMQHYESDKPPTICLVWGAIHLVWRLPVFWNPKNVMSRCDGVGRQDVGCTARMSFSCGVRETLTFTSPLYHILICWYSHP